MNFWKTKNLGQSKQCEMRVKKIKRQFNSEYSFENGLNIFIYSHGHEVDKKDEMKSLGLDASREKKGMLIVVSFFVVEFIL